MPSAPHLPNGSPTAASEKTFCCFVDEFKQERQTIPLQTPKRVNPQFGRDLARRFEAPALQIQCNQRNTAISTCSDLATEMLFLRHGVLARINGNLVGDSLEAT